jgi:hypothetical protein
MNFFRNLDLVLLALALPLFLVAGLPFLGWLTAAVIWAMWRLIGEWADRAAGAAAAEHDARKTAGIAAGSMVGRGWLLGLILLGVGLAAGDDVGLSAAVLALVLFTVHFTFKFILRSTEPQRPGIT